MKPQFRARLLAPVLALAVGAGLAGCGSSGEDSSAGSGGGDTTLTVLAASSLTESFTELKKQFEADHEGVSVKLVFDSSAALAELAEQGAPGDVLATAEGLRNHAAAARAFKKGRA